MRKFAFINHMHDAEPTRCVYDSSLSFCVSVAGKVLVSHKKFENAIKSPVLVQKNKFKVINEA